MPPKNKYTDPKLRDEVKEEIQQSDKGGAPGQWSARKMMAKEYKSRGGDYNQPKSDKDESQKHLDNWTKEQWQTKEGSGEAKQKDGSRKRYLPKKSWEEMDEEEKEETDQKKLRDGKDGTQFVANTARARKARKDVSESDPKKQDEEEDDVPEENTGKKRGRPKKENQEQQIEAAPKKGPSKKKEDENEVDEEEEEHPPSKKQKSSSIKKGSGATLGSKHDSADAPAQKASASRLPKKGQLAYWKAMPGWVDGKVMEIVKTSKEVEGKQIKASKDDPRIVLKSNAKSAKICVHKVDNVYFD